MQENFIDFNGDNRTDVGLLRQNPGWATLPVAFSDSDGNFTITNESIGDFGDWATQGNVEVLTGDFNGDNRTDVSLVRQNPGWSTLPVAFSDGDGSFTITNEPISSSVPWEAGHFANWATASNVEILTGDFNGDSMTDIALLRQDAGWATMPVAFSDGDGTFTVTNELVGSFATWATASDVEILTGDFNGDNLTDVGLLRQDAGWATMPVAFSNGDGSFTITNEGVGTFSSWATASNVEILTGDFNGDNRTDVGLLRQDAGWATMPVAFSDGDGRFTITNQGIGSFAHWATASDVDVLTGDFNGDNRTDVGLLRQDAGWDTMPVAFSDGDGTFTLTNEPIGSFADWATASDVDVLTGDFNGDDLTDVGLLRQDAGWNSMPIAFSDSDGSFTITNEYIGNFADWATRSGVEILG